MGKPEQNQNLWIDRSPINFLQSIKAKLLIIHGTNDSSIPLSEALLVKEKLNKIKYTDFTFEIYHDIGHASASIEIEIQIFNKILNYFLENL